MPSPTAEAGLAGRRRPHPQPGPCPVRRADAFFVDVAARGIPAGETMVKQSRLVMVGNGMAGVRALEELLKSMV